MVNDLQVERNKEHIINVLWRGKGVLSLRGAKAEELLQQIESFEADLQRDLKEAGQRVRKRRSY